jgi:DNA-binding response OmpR family regulator
MKKIILIVDDDAAVRESLARVLMSEDFAVVVAGEGNEAIARAREDNPHLLLLDINMPGLDGWQVYEMLSRAKPFLPVIIITAQPHEFPLASSFGVDALMEKPLNFPLLISTIKLLLAESAPDRVKRLANPEFATSYLPNSAAEPSAVKAGAWD